MVLFSSLSLSLSYAAISRSAMPPPMPPRLQSEYSHGPRLVSPVTPSPPPPPRPHAHRGTTRAPHRRASVGWGLAIRDVCRVLQVWAGGGVVLDHGRVPRAAIRAVVHPALRRAHRPHRRKHLHLPHGNDPACLPCSRVLMHAASARPFSPFSPSLPLPLSPSPPLPLPPSFSPSLSPSLPRALLLALALAFSFSLSLSFSLSRSRSRSPPLALALACASIIFS